MCAVQARVCAGQPSSVAATVTTSSDGLSRSEPRGEWDGGGLGPSRPGSSVSPQEEGSGRGGDRGPQRQGGQSQRATQGARRASPPQHAPCQTGGDRDHEDREQDECWNDSLWWSSCILPSASVSTRQQADGASGMVRGAPDCAEEAATQAIITTKSSTARIRQHCARQCSPASVIPGTMPALWIATVRRMSTDGSSRGEIDRAHQCDRRYTRRLCA